MMEVFFTFEKPRYDDPILKSASRFYIFFFKGQSFLWPDLTRAVIYPAMIWRNPFSRNDSFLLDTINHETLHCAIYQAGHDLAEHKDHWAINRLLERPRLRFI